MLVIAGPIWGAIKLRTRQAPQSNNRYREMDFAENKSDRTDDERIKLMIHERSKTWMYDSKIVLVPLFRIGILRKDLEERLVFTTDLEDSVERDRFVRRAKCMNGRHVVYERRGRSRRRI